MDNTEFNKQENANPTSKIKKKMKTWQKVLLAVGIIYVGIPLMNTIIGSVASIIMYRSSDSKDETQVESNDNSSQIEVAVDVEEETETVAEETQTPAADIKVYQGQWETIDAESGMSNFMTISWKTDTQAKISFECDLIPYGEDDYTMTGVLTDTGMTYSDCTKIYDSHGNTVDHQVQYTDGSGQLYFQGENLVLEVFEHYDDVGDVVNTFVFHRYKQ